MAPTIYKLDGVSVILQYDALELLSNIPDNTIDLLLTDIPYERVNKKSNGLRVLDKQRANTKTFSLEEFAKQVYRTVKGNCVIFCGKEQFSPLFQYFVDEGATTRMLVWEKTNPLPMNGKYVFLSGVECAVYFRKPKSVFNGHCENTVFRYGNGSSKRHPTEKPLMLFERLVELLSNEDDLVCDPCVGSGTTAVACRRLGRRYLCSDIDPVSVATANERLSCSI